MQKAKVVDQPAVITMPLRELGVLLLIGALVAIVMAVLYAVFDKYIFTPTLCGDSVANIGRCENKDILSAGFATVIAALAGLFVVVRQRTYRPLFVVLFATVTLWNLVLYVKDLPLAGSLVVLGLIGAFSYAAYGWIATLRNFVMSAVIATVLLIVARLLLG